MSWALVQSHHKPQEQCTNNNKIKDSGEGMYSPPTSEPKT